MPLLKLHTSAPADEDLLLVLSQTAAQTLGKPEGYVQTCLTPGAALSFGGQLGNSCLVEVSSIGALDAERTRALSAAVCPLLAERLGIPQDRIYIVFRDVPRHCWGWDGRTFAG